MSIAQWEKFKSTYFQNRELGFAIDISRMDLDLDKLRSYTPLVKEALDKMEKLEHGAIANPDEGRMVGHYWLRDDTLAPEPLIRNQIKDTLKAIKDFASDVHQGKIIPEKGGKFESLLVIGIGGSALGPQFVTQALGSPADALDIFFFDNTDPDGMQNILSAIPSLAKNLTIVISKSGGTKETRNGQLVAKAAYSASGLDFSKHFVAVTGEESQLDKTAQSENWLKRFPMWDWVGGRTSEFSAVGLLPAALQGYEIETILAGARAMDQMTRAKDLAKNPAALLAVSWHHVGAGVGSKDMVVLPYKDRLELFSRYLQQLVMESLGKKLDLDGNVVHQGIAVYGNKGSTDQHAYVQQLRDGLNNFFVVFLEVLSETSSKSVSADLPKTFNAAQVEVDPGVYSGDYLAGFLQGTRAALYDSDRKSVSITVSQVREYEIGMLIALFERAVGLYASLVNINAYHQPGVEAGKKAAADVLDLQERVMAHLRKSTTMLSVDEIAAQIGAPDKTETIFKIVQHLAANRRIAVETQASVFEDRYSARL
jgi:glucose-6-phosphate isomerase